MKPDYKLVAKAKYIHANADLASEIWHEVYKRYYPAKQLDTLVETLQSADAIEADIDNDVNYFLVVLGGKTIGYFAWKMENTALHLLHLYLSQLQLRFIQNNTQGAFIGRLVLHHG